jgi:two-component system copper resistance phosphate regulon response regulator CusR
MDELRTSAATTTPMTSLNERESGNRNERIEPWRTGVLPDKMPYMRVLVVEDQRKMANFIKQGLSEAGYSVDLAETGSSAELLAGENEYDLVILDVMLPDQNGLDTARHLRNDGFEKPILMLTALSGTKDKVAGLDSGADDYLAKPFEFDELLARVRALLRRQTTGGVGSVLRFEDIEMDLVKRKARRGTQELTLTQKEFALLEYFLRNPERPLTRTSIAEHVWDARFDSDSNVIDVYINMLRKKVDQPYPLKLIHTVVGVGYVLKREAH